MPDIIDRHASEVPAVTLGFWIVKVFATTLGETGGDAVAMTLGLGYLVGTAVFARWSWRRSAPRSPPCVLFIPQRAGRHPGEAQAAPS